MGVGALQPPWICAVFFCVPVRSCCQDAHCRNDERGSFLSTRTCLQCRWQWIIYYYACRKPLKQWQQQGEMRGSCRRRLIRCRILSSFCSQESRQGGIKDTGNMCVHDFMCQWLYVWEGVFILLNSSQCWDFSYFEGIKINMTEKEGRKKWEGEYECYPIYRSVLLCYEIIWNEFLNLGSQMCK